MATSAQVTTSGQVVSTPIIAQAVHLSCGASEGVVEMRDGGAAGDVLVTFTVPAETASFGALGEGVQFGQGLYVTLTGDAAVTVFWRKAQGAPK